ncbi:MAG: lysozyme inhibitor LprI family protein [Bacteroidales bacterium]
MRLLAVSLCLAALAATTAQAAPANCSGAMSAVEEAACNVDLAGSKKRLNAAYGALARKINRDYLPVLEKAQKTWLDFRNAQCDWESEPLGGGSMSSSAQIACTAQMNNARAAQLEGDLGNW